MFILTKKYKNACPKDIPKKPWWLVRNKLSCVQELIKSLAKDSVISLNIETWTMIKLVIATAFISMSSPLNGLSHGMYVVSLMIEVLFQDSPTTRAVGVILGDSGGYVRFKIGINGDVLDSSK